MEEYRAMQMRLSAMEWMEWNELERTQHHERGVRNWNAIKRFG
jgi:hypothetical protein